MFNNLRKVLTGYTKLDPSKYSEKLKETFDLIDEYYNKSIYVKKHGHSPEFSLPNDKLTHPFIEEFFKYASVRGYKVNHEDNDDYTIFTLNR
jgi:hypothetical protein